MPELRNRYLMDLGHHQAAAPWDPRETDAPPRLDCVYFGRALVAMESALGSGGLTVVLTWDVEELPVYGPDVVAVVLGDEASRHPRYAHRVRCVFKCYGHRPHVAGDFLRAPSRLSAMTFLEDVRRLVRALPDRARSTRDAPVYEIPLGYYNQLDLPLRPFEHRGTSVFFAGSTATAGGGSGRRPGLLVSPRLLSRSQMLDAVARFQRRRPDHRTVMRLTPGFASVTREGASEYSQALMDSRICLSPRGGSVETFRFFEAMRYGCVVITEPLPPRWFYRGAPVVTVRRWDGLPDVLESLLDDPNGLAERHAATLDWWRERCSEQALGAYLARQLERSRG